MSSCEFLERVNRLAHKRRLLPSGTKAGCYWFLSTICEGSSCSLPDLYTEDMKSQETNGANRLDAFYERLEKRLNLHNLKL